MSIETEYRGYKIRYSENEDKWVCYDARASNASLAKVKQKIDKLHRDIRKSAAFDCIFLGRHYHDSVDTSVVRAIDYRVTEKRKSPGNYQYENYDHHEVAVMRNRGVGSAKGKNWEDLRDLAPISPEVDAAIELAAERAAEVRSARDRFREAFDAIPRLSLSDLGNLVHAATEARLEEDDDDA